MRTTCIKLSAPLAGQKDQEEAVGDPFSSLLSLVLLSIPPPLSSPNSLPFPLSELETSWESEPAQAHIVACREIHVSSEGWAASLLQSEDPEVSLDKNSWLNKSRSFSPLALSKPPP